MKSELQRLSILLSIVTRHGHRVATESDRPAGSAGPYVSFGLDAGGAYVALGDRRMSDDEAKTMIADLLNAIDQAEFFAWRQEQLRGVPGVDPVE